MATNMDMFEVKEEIQEDILDIDSEASPSQPPNLPVAGAAPTAAEEAMSSQTQPPKSVVDVIEEQMDFDETNTMQNEETYAVNDITIVSVKIEEVNSDDVIFEEDALAGDDTNITDKGTYIISTKSLETLGPMVIMAAPTAAEEAMSSQTQPPKSVVDVIEEQMDFDETNTMQNEKTYAVNDIKIVSVRTVQENSDDVIFEEDALAGDDTNITDKGTDSEEEQPIPQVQKITEAVPQRRERDLADSRMRSSRRQAIKERAGDMVDKKQTNLERSRNVRSSGRARRGGLVRGTGAPSPPRAPATARARPTTTQISDAMVQVRPKRQVIKNHTAKLTASQRKELQRIPLVVLDRILLPDAPPRKRRTQRPSPKRNSSSKFLPSAASTSGNIAVPQEEPLSSPALEDEGQYLIIVPGGDDDHATGNNAEMSLDDRFLVPGLVVDDGTSSGSVMSQRRPSPKTSTTRTETEGGIDIQTFESIRQVLDNVDENVGSDIEEDEDVPGSATMTLKASDYPAGLPEDINANDRDRILQLDKDDDDYLQTKTDADKLDFDWTKDKTIFEGTKEDYLGSAGPTFDFDHDSPLAILEMIWDSEVMSLIVDQTNIYGQQLLNNPLLKKQSRLKAWKEITVSDLWLFFCILILQGLDIRATESEYWYSKLEVLDMPKFGAVMPYKKFVLIKKCLHFVNNQTLPSVRDKAVKIRPIVDHLNKKFSEMYAPAQEIALDESLLLWKGRLSFAQKIDTKAAGVGLNSYELCESKSGYLWSFRLYTGEDNVGPDKPDSKTSAIVFDLMEPLLNKGHVLYMDNFYNSPLLSRLLKLQKTDTIGTLRLNRTFVPTSIKTLNKSDLRVGEVAFSNTKDLTVILWRDCNLVSLISTFHTVNIGGKEKYGTYKYKPQVVLDYNTAMGALDKKDQLLSAFPMERTRNHVWYKKLFRRLLNVSVTNSWIIMKSKKDMSHRSFREKLVTEIISKYQTKPSNTKIVKNTSTTGRPFLIGGHYITKGTVKRAKCRLCLKLGKDARTTKICDVCQIPLCVEPCFKKYHTQVI